MSKYTSDDNRSMQLNDNNDRYYSSRGIDRYDNDEEDIEQYSSPSSWSNGGDCYYSRKRELEMYSCPHGCHEQSPYPPDQYPEYECYHKNRLNLGFQGYINKVDYFSWYHENEPKGGGLDDSGSSALRLYWAKKGLNELIELLNEMPYVPTGWNINLTRVEKIDGIYKPILRDPCRHPNPYAIPIPKRRFNNGDIVVATAWCFRGQLFTVLENYADNGSAQVCCKVLNMETDEIEIYPANWFIRVSK